MNTRRKGIVLAGGSGTRLHPLTVSISKQLMPVYDKPMIYYSMSVLMFAHIREILIITTPRDQAAFENLLGDGSQWGLELSYAIQPEPKGLAQAFIIGESFLGNSPAALVLGDNLFYGHDFSKTVADASSELQQNRIFGYYVRNPETYGVVEFDEHNNVLSIEEKPKEPKSNYAVPGLYFYDSRVTDFAKSLQPSKRGELEITDLNRIYMERGELKLQLLGRGTAWLDTGSHDTLLDAGNFVKAIESRQSLKIACLDEIAYHKGWISRAQLETTIAQSQGSTYSQYLKMLLT